MWKIYYARETLKKLKACLERQVLSPEEEGKTFLYSWESVLCLCAHIMVSAGHISRLSFFAGYHLFCLETVFYNFSDNLVKKSILEVV